MLIRVTWIVLPTRLIQIWDFNAFFFILFIITGMDGSSSSSIAIFFRIVSVARAQPAIQLAS